MRRNKIKFIIGMQFLIISVIACRHYSDSESCHYSINVINNSDKDLCVHVWNSYPDTTLSYDPSPNANLNRIIPKYSTNDIALFHRSCYEGDFSSGHFGADTMMIFVYDLNILNTTPWDTIKKYNMVLKRYDLSLQDLQRTNWTITYP